LTDADRKRIVICMRTTLNLDEKLLEEAQAATGLPTRTAVIEAGLRALVAQAARRRLAALRGAVPELKETPRRRAGGAKA
jgi:Arc/MetJ family transcription regulator